MEEATLEQLLAAQKAGNDLLKQILDALDEIQKQLRALS